MILGSTCWVVWLKKRSPVVSGGAAWRSVVVVVVDERDNRERARRPRVGRSRALLMVDVGVVEPVVNELELTSTLVVGATVLVVRRPRARGRRAA